MTKLGKKVLTLVLALAVLFTSGVVGVQEVYAEPASTGIHDIFVAKDDSKLEQFKARILNRILYRDVEIDVADLDIASNEIKYTYGTSNLTGEYAARAIVRDNPFHSTASTLGAPVFTYKDNGCVKTVKFEYTYTWTETDIVERAIAGYDEAMALIQPGDSDFAKILKLHDWVVKNVSYGMSKPYSDFAIGALANKSSVCGGYAQCYGFLLSQAGIDSIYVVANTTTELHAWNLVKLEDHWFHVDCTWDRGLGVNPNVNHTYFMLSDAEFNADGVHTEDWKDPAKGYPTNNVYAIENKFYKDNTDIATDEQIAANPIIIKRDSAVAPTAITLSDATYSVGDSAAALDGTTNVTDGGTVTYQWYRNTSASNAGGTPIDGGTGATYIPSTATAGVFYYYVVATNTNGATIDAKPVTTTSNAATITVQQTYKVTFVDWNGTVLNEQSVLSGAAATAPDDPKRSGFVFTGWDKSFDNVTQDLTIKATYSQIKPGEKTYSVEHYQQDLIGDGYSLADTEHLTASADSVVYAVARSYTGFSEDTGNADRVVSGTVSDKGDLVLKLYYNRNLCHVTYNGNGSDGGVVPTDDTAYRYGATVTVANATMTRTGYTFDYWKGSSYQPGDTFVITDNHVLTAQWKANPTNPTEPTTPTEPSIPTESSTPVWPTVPFEPDDLISPKTGDNSMMWLWIVLLCVSSAGMVVIAVFSKKKRSNKL